MVIGYDAKRLFHNTTGLGYYSRTLVQSLIESIPDFKAVLFDSDPVQNKLTGKFFSHEKVDIIKLSKPGWYARSFSLDPYLRRQQIDVFHGLSNELPLLKSTKNIPRVVTIHDVLYKTFKRDFPWHDRIIYDLKTRSALRKADTIIAISQATKASLINDFKVKEEKIIVIYQSYDPIFDIPVMEVERAEVLSTYRLPASYMLYVGSITFRKNLKVIIDAMLCLPQDDRIPLVVAGQGTSYEQYIRRYIQQHHLEDIIFFLPGLPRMNLRILYSGATVLIYPSLGEGFGLPVLEGIACNIPVITSNRSSMPEAGGAVASYFDPTRPEQLADLIRQPLTGLKNNSHPERTIHLERFNRFNIVRQYFEEVYSPLVK